MAPGESATPKYRTTCGCCKTESGRTSRTSCSATPMPAHSRRFSTHRLPAGSAVGAGDAISSSTRATSVCQDEPEPCSKAPSCRNPRGSTGCGILARAMCPASRRHAARPCESRQGLACTSAQIAQYWYRFCGA